MLIIIYNLQFIFIYKRMNPTIQAKLSDYAKQINQIKSNGIKYKPTKAEVQIQRLLNQKFYNPYDVLLLQATATDEDVKKQYRTLSLLLHPDRCKDPRSTQAFGIVQQSHKTLIDGEKKKIYIRIMRQARQRANFEREKQNKKRQKNGQLPLDQSTFPEFYQQICNKIFKQLDDKKNHLIKMQQSKYQKNIQDLQVKGMIEKFKIQTEEEWERSRQKRVSNWREFNQQKFIVGSRRSDGAIRPPPARTQVRPHYAVIQEKKKNI